MRELARRVCEPQPVADGPSPLDDMHMPAARQRLATRRTAVLRCTSTRIVYDLDNGQLYRVYLDFRSAEEIMSWLDALERAGVSPPAVEAARNYIRAGNTGIFQSDPSGKGEITVDLHGLSADKWGLSARVMR